MKRAFYLLSCVLIFLGFFTVTFAQPVNNDIGNSAEFDGEPFIAINPTNNQNLVVAWMGLNLTGGTTYKTEITIRSSFDGGNSWSAAITLPHYSPTFTSADPSMAFDKNGLLYLCYIDFNEAASKGGDYVARSYNGGLAWDTATEAIDVNDVPDKLPIDRPWLVVDHSNTANAGTLYLTSKPVYWVAPPNRNYYKVSSDSGHTWSAIANVDGGTHLVGNYIVQPMATPATTINGNFCAVYPSYVASQNIYPAYYFATSINKGQTFSYSTVYTGPAAPVDTNLKSGYRLAADPIDSNDLAFFEIDSSLGEADIYALNSTNGGQTWSSKVKINDDPSGTGKDHDLVWGSYNSQGNLVTTWRDRRNADTGGFWNAGYDFYYALSTNNGQTFSANKLLSSQFIAFDSAIAAKGNDFMSCAYEADTLYTVWGDTRSGSMNIYFVKTIASTDSTLGIKLLQGNAPRWSIYPNPFKNELNVDASNEMVGKEIGVYNLGGKVIYTTQIPSNKFKLATAAYAAGSYFVKVDNAVMKVMKQ